jgi:hypothetical protein
VKDLLGGNHLDFTPLDLRVATLDFRQPQPLELFRWRCIEAVDEHTGESGPIVDIELEGLVLDLLEPG